MGEFQNQAASGPDQKYKLNIWTTDHCNQACEYCLALDLLSADESNADYLSHSDLHEILDWINTNPSIQRHGHFLMGGEPSQHFNLKEVFEHFSEANIKLGGMFTNGNLETEKLKFIDSMIRKRDSYDFRIVFNVAHPDEYTDEEWQRVEENLSLFTYDNWSNQVKNLKQLQLANRAALAITLYEKDQDYDYVIELAKKHNINVIRTAVSKPSWELSNKHVNFQQLREMSDLIIDFARDCAENNLVICFDCIVQPCVFTVEEWIFLDQCTSRLVSHCSMPLDVLPDLSVIYCSAAAGMFNSLKVGEADSSRKLNEIVQQANRVRNLPLERCQDCQFFINKKCQGACLRKKQEALEEQG